MKFNNCIMLCLIVKGHLHSPPTMKKVTVTLLVTFTYFITFNKISLFLTYRTVTQPDIEIEFSPNDKPSVYCVSTKKFILTCMG